MSKVKVLHELKISPEYFKAVDEGIKTFEIRKNDRNYQVNDYLLLREFDGKEFTGNNVLRKVTYMTDYEQKQGYVVLSIVKCNKTVKSHKTFNR